MQIGALLQIITPLTFTPQVDHRCCCGECVLLTQQKPDR